MIRSLIAMGLVLGSFQVATAQTNTETRPPTETWQQFIATCTQVISDPDAYLSSLPIPGSVGERVISVSPDRNVVSVYFQTGNIYDEIQLHLIGARQLRDCAVIGEHYDTPTEALAARLVEIVSREPSLSITGGQAPQDYPESGAIFTEDEIYLFAIDGLWPDQGLIATAHVIGGELQLTVQHVVN